MPFSARVKWAEFRLDGQHIFDDAERQYMCIPIKFDKTQGSTGRRTLVGGLPSSPAIHDFTAYCSIEIFDECVFRGGEPIAAPIYTTSRVHSGRYEVLAESPPDYIRLRSDPQLDAAIARSISFSVMSRSLREPIRDRSRYFSFSLEGQVLADRALPIPVAFEAWLEIAGKEYLARDRLVCVPDNSVRRSWVQFDAPELTERPVDIRLILRSSAQIAEQTTNIFEIWDGELHFDAIDAHPAFRSPRVVRRSSATSPARDSEQ